MAMAVGGKGAQKADINVTPLVDVVLVLLIIFMVVSPAAIAQVPNSVPRPALTSVSRVLTTEQLVVELLPDGSGRFGGNLVSMADFGVQLARVIAARTDRTLFVAADDAVPYGAVVAWMATARRAGAATVALQLSPLQPLTPSTQPPEQAPAP